MTDPLLPDSSTSRFALSLDPRTKLLLLITIAMVVALGDDGNPPMRICKFILVIIPFVGLLSERRVKAAVGYLLAFALAHMVSLFALPHIGGIGNSILVAICVAFSRMMPGIAMGWYLLISTSVSEFMASLERMHVPFAIVIPLSVIFRFLPTVKEEYTSINDAMRMRGVSLGGGKAGDILEYRLVPLMICSVKIGEELSAAALTRGLGAPVKRTNICNIRLGILDVLLCSLCLSSLVLLVVQSVS